MILALLAALLITAGSGWFARAPGGRIGRRVEEPHEAAANGLPLLIGLHVLGVPAESWREGQNLVLAMITGVTSTARRAQGSGKSTGIDDGRRSV
jgi:cytochrome b